MRIAIVGGGASGLYSALLIRQDHPTYEVEIFEKEKKLGRKLCATGNGRCNLLNADLRPEKYNLPAVMKGALSAYPFDYLASVISSFGVPLVNEGDLIYPYALSANVYVDYLVSLCSSFGVKSHLGVRVTAYEIGPKGIALSTDDGQEYLLFDKIIFTTGGASSAKLGSDGNTFPLLAKHGYRIVPLRPGLCPLKVKDKKEVQPLAGYRRSALVRAYAAGHRIFEERGEILYKDDGLSGIVIFNAQSALSRLNGVKGAVVALDLFPDTSKADLLSGLTAYWKLNPQHFLEAYYPLPFLQHLAARLRLPSCTKIKEKDLAPLADLLKDLRYEIADSYGYENSQVTLGGIDFSEVDEGLQSKKEKGVYFAGEIMNLDGFCGGYNLTWALISALVVDEAL
jgi:predicted Rossmann fold flavoprotein